MSPQANQHYGTGRRKTASARVFMRPGSGEIEVNGRTFDDYFMSEALRMIVRQPLALTETGDKFDLFVTVAGGGQAGQAGAVRHGIARALIEFDGERGAGHHGGMEVPGHVERVVHDQVDLFGAHDNTGDAADKAEEHPLRVY